MRTISWTGLSGQPEPLPAAPDRIVHRPAVLVEGLEPVLPVPADVLRELRDEGLGGEPAPVPAVEELDLQPPEEALAGGVVREWIGNTYLDGFDRISPAFLNSTGLM